MKMKAAGGVHAHIAVPNTVQALGRLVTARITCAQLQEAVVEEDEDDWMDDWRREQAMEAGMMGGCDAYNEVMGY